MASCCSDTSSPSEPSPPSAHDQPLSPAYHNRGQDEFTDVFAPNIGDAPHNSSDFVSFSDVPLNYSDFPQYRMIRMGVQQPATFTDPDLSGILNDFAAKVKGCSTLVDSWCLDRSNALIDIEESKRGIGKLQVKVDKLEYTLEGKFEDLGSRVGDLEVKVDLLLQKFDMILKNIPAASNVARDVQVGAETSHKRRRVGEI